MIGFLYDIIYALPIGELLILMLEEGLGISTGLPGMLLVAVCILLIFVIRHVSLKLRILIGGITTTLVLVIGIVMGADNRALIREHLIEILCCLGLTLCGVVLGILMRRVAMIGRIIVLLIWAAGASAMILQIPTSHMTVIFALFVTLLVAMQEVQTHWMKSGHTLIREHMVRLAPFPAVLCLLVLLLPAPDRPYDWQLFRDGWDLIYVGFQEVIGPMIHPDEEYSSMGFSGDSGFFSGLSANDTTVMRVRFYRSNSNVVYLSGRVFDRFDGASWSADENVVSTEHILDAIELRSAVTAYNEKGRSDFLIRTQNDIESRFYRTNYIFTPTKMLLTGDAFRDLSYEEYTDCVQADRLIRYGTEYSAEYLVLNRDHPELATMIDSAGPISEELWEKSATELQAHRTEGDTYADYQAYLARIREQYCPETPLSKEVDRILHEVTDVSSTDYEKMACLQDYFSSFTYSTTPGTLPEQVSDAASFMDYLCLTSREGYCVHFASAFVLAARHLGYPARYVQGYRVDRPNNVIATVTENQAHAWPEVYFDNVGWLVFEPTPGYELPAGWRSGYLPAVVQVDDRSGQSTDGEQILETEQVEEEYTEAQTHPNLKLILIPAAAAAAFLLIFLLVNRGLIRLRYRRSTLEDKLCQMVHRNEVILRKLGSPMEQSETLKEYRTRLSEVHLAYLEDYEAVIYGDRPVTQEMVTKAEEAYHTLRRRLRESRFRYRILYLWY